MKLIYAPGIPFNYLITCQIANLIYRTMIQIKDGFSWIAYTRLYDSRAALVAFPFSARDNQGTPSVPELREGQT